jgi:hypothetical protein
LIHSIPIHEVTNLENFILRAIEVSFDQNYIYVPFVCKSNFYNCEYWKSELDLERKMNSILTFGDVVGI